MIEDRADRPRDPQNGVWEELLLEDRKAGPAATAAARLDLRAWLRTLSKRNRQIARALAVGETTNAVAQQFGLSAGRISQLRNLFRAHWERFHGGASWFGRRMKACIWFPQPSLPNSADWAGY